MTPKHLKLMMSRGGYTIEHSWRPHFTLGAVEFLERILDKTFVCLETGCGSSTMWLAKLCKNLISFEHNKSWYQSVNEILRKNNIANVNFIYDPQYPKEGLKNIDGSFDLICIDGRSRRKIIMQVHNLLKSGRYLILDDSHRKYYQCVKEFLEEMLWIRADFFSFPKECWPNVTGTTTIWRKP